jgi:predicted nuclease of predicted toxin-antitoxin system
VIVAADTDFGELLAHQGLPYPSVVLFHRQTERRPLAQAALLLSNLDVIEDDLRKGTIVVIEDHRLRIRALPIRSDDG